MKKDYYDIIMSGIFLSSSYAQQIELSKPYLNVTLALVVKKDNTNFDNFESTTAIDTFTIAYFERKEIAKEFASYFPKAGIRAIPNINDFFLEKGNDTIVTDAYLTSAERASALTIHHPEYKMVNPLPYHMNNALVFPIANDRIWSKFVDKWIDFRTNDGTIGQIYKQWILGQKHKVKK